MGSPPTGTSTMTLTSCGGSAPIEIAPMFTALGDRDVDAGTQLRAHGEHVVDRVALELLDQRRIARLALVDGGEGQLREEVVEARGPLARAEARRRRAVVDHVRDAAGVHVRVERVDRLDDRFVRR